MVSELSVSLGLILLPIALGLSARIPGISHAGVQLLAFTGIGTALGALVYLASTFDADPVRIQLGAAILLTGLCAILGQGKSKMSSTVLGTILVVLGLSLGVLLAPTPIDSVSLLSLFSYAAFLVIRSQHPATLKTFSLVQLGVAMLLILASLVVGNTYNLWAGLFLAVTLFPLIPFHAPFLSIVSTAEGMLSGFWVMVLIALGLAELNDLQHSMPLTELWVIPIFALGSGLIASLKCQGEDPVSTIHCLCRRCTDGTIMGDSPGVSRLFHMGNSVWSGNGVHHERTVRCLCFSPTTIWVASVRSIPGIGFGDAPSGNVHDSVDHLGHAASYSSYRCRITNHANIRTVGCVLVSHVVDLFGSLVVEQLVFFPFAASNGFWKGTREYSVYRPSHL